MKVLLVSSSSGSRGGGELFLIYLGKALAKRGHQVSLWASDHGRMDELCERFAPVGPVLRRPYRNTYDRRTRSVGAWLDGRTPGRIAPEWRAHDLIHINKQNLEDGFELLAAARIAGRPTVATVHLTQTARYLGARFAWVRDGVARRALRAYPGEFAAVLDLRAEALSRFLGGRRAVSAIPNGVPLPERSATPGVRAGIRVVGVGRMVAQKRPMLFLEEAARVVKASRDAEVIWVGDGPLAGEWDRRVAELGLGGRVRRVGWQADVGGYLAEADLFLHVAEYEGLPLAVLEAMAVGLPCALSPNLAEELRFLDRSASRVVGERDWGDVLRDRNGLAAMGKAAREIVEARFSCDAMALQYEALYRHATDDHPTANP
jgi:glycosyltransferase involved in cell wall biosynthesis